MQHKSLGLRTDLNSNTSGDKLDDKVRIDRYIPYLESISQDFETVYVMSHQGRKGGDDFISLKPHFEYIDNNTGSEVIFCPKGEIENYSRYLNAEADIVVLDNVRFFESEAHSYENPKDAVNTELVSNLSNYFSTYMNDAFSVSHRSHASIVGFPEIMNSRLGPLFKEEVSSFRDGLWSTENRCCVVGGSKLEDKCRYIHSFIQNGNAESILTTGEVSNVFLDRMDYDVGTDYSRKLSDDVISKVDKSLKYDDTLYVPDDVAIDRSGRECRKVDDLEDSYSPLDIGYSTIKSYKSVIGQADSVLMAGPPGMYEKEGFERASVSLLEEVASHDHGVIAGGDTILSAETLGVSGFEHKSYGGGSALHYLSRGYIPGMRSINRNNT